MIWYDISCTFFVKFWDVKAMTNGRLMSVRHRALTSSVKARLSMMYFGAPPLNAWISPLPDMVSPQKPSLYRPFSWVEYKKAAYSLRLGDRRLDLFKINTSSTGDKVELWSVRKFCARRKPNSRRCVYIYIYIDIVVTHMSWSMGDLMISLDFCILWEFYVNLVWVWSYNTRFFSHCLSN